MAYSDHPAEFKVNPRYKAIGPRLRDAHLASVAHRLEHDFAC
jgi:hypothetical protein